MPIPVTMVADLIATGASCDEVLAEFPELEHEDISQAIEYVAWLEQEHAYSPQLFAG